MQPIATNIILPTSYTRTDVVFIKYAQKSQNNLKINLDSK